MIRKQGKKYLLVAKSTGKVLGRHSSRTKAIAQETAIRLSKLRRAGQLKGIQKSKSVGLGTVVLGIAGLVLGIKLLR